MQLQLDFEKFSLCPHIPSISGMPSSVQNSHHHAAPDQSAAALVWPCQQCVAAVAASANTVGESDPILFRFCRVLLLSSHVLNGRARQISAAVSQCLHQFNKNGASYFRAFDRQASEQFKSYWEHFGSVSLPPLAGQWRQRKLLECAFLEGQHLEITLILRPQRAIIVQRSTQRLRLTQHDF